MTSKLLSCQTQIARAFKAAIRVETQGVRVSIRVLKASEVPGPTLPIGPKVADYLREQVKPEAPEQILDVAFQIEIPRKGGLENLQSMLQELQIEVVTSGQMFVRLFEMLSWQVRCVRGGKKSIAGLIRELENETGLVFMALRHVSEAPAQHPIGKNNVTSYRPNFWIRSMTRSPQFTRHVASSRDAADRQQARERLAGSTLPKRTSAPSPQDSDISACSVQPVAGLQPRKSAI